MASVAAQSAAPWLHRAASAPTPCRRLPDNASPDRMPSRPAAPTTEARHGTQVLHAAGKMLPRDGTRSVPQHRECPTADDECTEKTTSTKSQNTTKTTPNRPRLLGVMWRLILDFAGTKHRLIIRHDDTDDPEAQLQTQLLTRALQEAGLIRRWSVTQQCQLNRCIHWFQLESSRWSLSCTNSLLQ